MREQIISLLEEVLPQIDFNSSDHLVDDRILDSISIVTLVSELSVEFGITFDLNRLKPENLNSIDAIVQTVESLMKK